MYVHVDSNYFDNSDSLLSLVKFLIFVLLLNEKFLPSNIRTRQDTILFFFFFREQLVFKLQKECGS